MQENVITVLLVDDHSLVRRAFRRVLEDEPDIRVVGEASDGHEAVEIGLRLRPKVVAMDFGLPNMTGAETTQHLLKALPSSAVLILSMHSEPIYVRAALDAGARGYLLKSSVDVGLADALRKVAAGHQVLDKQLVQVSSRSGEATRPLSSRELEVLQLIARGKSNKQIAALLGISEGTVGVHKANIMRELGVHNTARLTLYAIGRGLLNKNKP